MSIGEFLDRYSRVYVVEQNRDAQMLSLMRLEFSPDRIGKLRKVLHFNGLPIDARSITDEILAQEGLKPAESGQRLARFRGTRVAPAGQREQVIEEKHMPVATPEPGKKTNRIGLEHAALSGRQDDALCRVRA